MFGEYTLYYVYKIDGIDKGVCIELTYCDDKLTHVTTEEFIP